MSERPIVHYTFGNHMHWVDMTWLWGDHVLPGSVRDMLDLCRRAGVQGNVNFEGAGYERLASDDPEAFAELAAAVAAGIVEPVGGSYGQPYGLFHGGESNVRQRVFGARTLRRLLGVRLRTFWEEEFDFFPQLPQMLAGVGVTHASLFFQWTWHTPHVPEEEAPAVWWIGLDGTRLLTAPRGPLNLHQWPEDLDRLLSSDLPRRLTRPGILQWLELMPSPDWMCRTELVLPPLERLLARDDLDVRPTTLRGYLDGAVDDAVDRTYAMSDVFHGMSLGKNGDAFRRLSRQAEGRVQAAEALATVTSRFGRPYPRWDVYPAWELAEAWRELLTAQHHDNDECEGLCGHVGALSYQRSLGLSGHVLATTGRALAARTRGSAGRQVVFNPLGWARDVLTSGPDGTWRRVDAVPAMGYRVIENEGAIAWRDGTEVVVEPAAFTLVRGALRVRVDRRRGTIEQIHGEGRPRGLLDAPIGDLALVRAARPETFDGVVVRVAQDALGPYVRVVRSGREGHELVGTIRLAPLLDAVDVEWHSDEIPRPDGGVAAALVTTYAIRGMRTELIHDHPYGVSPIEPRGRYPRKYPTGDWMTSPQWFEGVDRPFTGASLVDLQDDVGGGLLVLHDGSQAFGIDDEGAVRQILSLYDPWDEDYFDAALAVRLRLVPHRGLRHAERWRLAQEFTRPPLTFTADRPGDELPTTFGLVSLQAGGSDDAASLANGVAIVAVYREDERAGERHEGYAGRGMGHPTVIRLVEFDGASSPVEVRVVGTVAAAYRTDLLGERGEPLDVTVVDGTSRLRLTLAPHQIATVILDLVEARKVARDLDAKREVWAQVHRHEAALSGETGVNDGTPHA